MRRVFFLATSFSFLFLSTLAFSEDVNKWLFLAPAVFSIFILVFLSYKKERDNNVIFALEVHLNLAVVILSLGSLVFL